MSRQKKVQIKLWLPTGLSDWIIKKATDIHRTPKQLIRETLEREMRLDTNQHRCSTSG